MSEGESVCEGGSLKMKKNVWRPPRQGVIIDDDWALALEGIAWRLNVTDDKNVILATFNG